MWCSVFIFESHSNLYLYESYTESGLWSYQFSFLSKPHFSLRFMIFINSGREQRTLLRYDWPSQFCHQTFRTPRILSAFQSLSLHSASHKLFMAPRIFAVSFISLFQECCNVLAWLLLLIPPSLRTAISILSWHHICNLSEPDPWTFSIFKMALNIPEVFVYWVVMTRVLWSLLAAN